MSLLDVAPIIENMLQISENVSDLNFSTGQKPQVEINGKQIRWEQGHFPHFKLK